jgi:hypothetical protein
MRWSFVAATVTLAAFGCGKGRPGAGGDGAAAQASAAAAEARQHAQEREVARARERDDFTKALPRLRAMIETTRSFLRDSDQMLRGSADSRQMSRRLSRCAELTEQIIDAGQRGAPAEIPALAIEGLETAGMLADEADKAAMRSLDALTAALPAVPPPGAPAEPAAPLTEEAVEAQIAGMNAMSGAGDTYSAVGSAATEFHGAFATLLTFVAESAPADVRRRTVELMAEALPSADPDIRDAFELRMRAAWQGEDDPPTRAAMEHILRRSNVALDAPDAGGPGGAGAPLTLATPPSAR